MPVNQCTQTALFMDKKLKTFISTAGSASLLVAGACAGMHFGSPMVGNIVGGILTNIASNKFEQAQLHKIRDIMSRTNPADLNHDLEKLIQEALVWSTKNISYLYKAYCFDKEQKTALKNITEEIISTINNVDKTIWQVSDEILNQVNDLNDSKELITGFIKVKEEWPIINPDKPFPQFYQDQFLDNFKLCFGELLKDEDHRPALIAYNRNVSTQIQRNLEENKTQLDALTASNAEIKAALTKLTATPQERFEQEFVFPQITVELDKYLKPLYESVGHLVKQNEEILTEILEVKQEGRIQTQKIEALGDKVDKNLRNKIIYAVILPALAIATAYLAYRYWQNQQPFIYTVSVTNGSVNTQLPYETPEVSLIYDDKTETLTATNGEAIFKGLPPYLREDSVQLRISSYGFLPVDTTVTVTQNNVAITHYRDDTYATLNGVVKDDATDSRLADATVIVLDLAVQTDENGYFSLTIPESKQQTELRLTVEKAGYRTWNRIEPVLKNAETTVRLEPL